MFSAIKKDSLRQAHSFILALLTALVFLSQGCMSLPVRHPLPENLLDQVQVRWTLVRDGTAEIGLYAGEREVARILGPLRAHLAERTTR